MLFHNRRPGLRARIQIVERAIVRNACSSLQKSSLSAPFHRWALEWRPSYVHPQAQHRQTFTQHWRELGLGRRFNAGTFSDRSPLGNQMTDDTISDAERAEEQLYAAIDAGDLENGSQDSIYIVSAPPSLHWSFWTPYEYILCYMLTLNRKSRRWIPQKRRQ